jgi:hypothetical protein
MNQNLVKALDEQGCISANQNLVKALDEQGCILRNWFWKCPRMTVFGKE